MLFRSKDYQTVIDTRMAELFDGLSHPQARDEFVTKYAEMMSGEGAVSMRRELNDARKKLIEIVGGPCT